MNSTEKSPVARGKIAGKGGRHVAFFVLEIVAQAAIFVSGLVVLHLLPKQEYALYFTLLTVVGMASLIGNAGLSPTFFKIAGPLVNEKQAFAAAFATLKSTRKLILAVLLPVLCLVAWSALHSQSVGIARALWLLVIFVLTCVAVLLQVVQLDALRLLSEFNTLQKNKIVTEAIRSVSLVIVLKLWPRVEGLMLVTALTTWGQSLWLERLCAKHEINAGEIDEASRREYFKSFRSLLPLAIYSALQGQITTLLLAWFGASAAVAELGALTRLGRAMDIVVSYINQVAVPASARCTSRAKFKQLFLKVALGCLTLCGFVVFVGAFFAPALLWILGASYGNLQPEVFVYSFAISQNLLIGLLVSINQARGWFALTSVWQVPLSLIGLVFGIWFFGVKTTHAVLLMGLFARLPVLVLQIAEWVRGYRLWKTA